VRSQVRSRVIAAKWPLRGDLAEDWFAYLEIADDRAGAQIEVFQHSFAI
jgi:hypothetical protein